MKSFTCFLAETLIRLVAGLTILVIGFVGCDESPNKVRCGDKVAYTIIQYVGNKEIVYTTTSYHGGQNWVKFIDIKTGKKIVIDGDHAIIEGEIDSQEMK